jgi:HK97 family phage portal protein
MAERFKWLSGVGQAVKRFTAMIFSRSTWTLAWGGLPTSRFDFRGMVGDGSGSSIVAACLRFLTTTFPEAPLQVVRLESDGGRTVLPAHPLVLLLERPNAAYSGPILWAALLSDLFLAGNAYIAKVRSRGGKVVELWWLPQQLVTPRWPESGDSSVWVSHYDYSPNGQPIRLDVLDVVHLRYRLDPQNPRLGTSPLASVMAEIWSDMEAQAFSAALLRNTGVPGVIISPDAEKATINQPDAEMMKSNFMQKFGGDHRGEPMVVQGAIKATILSFTPEQMNLTSLRRLPEERVCAVLGVPAVVAGMGVGMDHSIYNNVSQAREAAYEELVIPLQRLLAADLSTQLLGEFGDSGALRIQFDLSQVKVLQEDQDKIMLRAGIGFKDGILTRAEARELVGMPAEEVDNVFALPVQMGLIARDQDAADLAPALPAPADQLALPPGKGRKADPPAVRVTDADVAHAVEWVAGLGLPELEAAVRGTNGKATNGKH